MFTPSELALCPLCRRDNACGNITGVGSCWCKTEDMQFPQALLDRVPDKKKLLVCICQQCASQFQQDNETSA